METACIGAIIGFGGMGNWHYRSIRDEMEELRIKGVYDIRPEAQEDAQQNGLYVYGSMEELLADDEVQLVIIAVPNNFHKSLSITCLRGGKHVICEKPVTMNTAELEEIIAVAEETGRLFTVHQNRRWDTDYATVKKIIQDGTIGTPYFIETRVQGSRGSLYGWRGHKLNGGGMLYDWGVHLLDQLLDLIDSPVVSVTAHLLSIFSEEVDDNIKVFLRFENGVSALCEVSTNCFINLPRWHVSCTDGTAILENWGWDFKGKMVQLATEREMEWADEIVYTAAGPTRTMAPRPKHTTRELPLPEVKTRWTDYYRNVVAAIEGREELIVQPAQALRVMKLVDLAFESARRNVGLSCRI